MIRAFFLFLLTSHVDIVEPIVEMSYTLLPACLPPSSFLLALELLVLNAYLIVSLLAA